MATPTKQEVKEWVRLFVSQQGNQSGLDGLDEILDAIIDVAWSGTPGPGPDLDKCVQVDRAQSFTDTEKQQGRENLGIFDVDLSKCVMVDRVQPFTLAEKLQAISNLGPQEIQDAIKELAAVLKNKTIDADDNTIENLTGENVKSGHLVGDITSSDKYFGWERTGYPDIYTKTTADAPSVDIYGLTSGKMTLLGTARISAGNLVRDTVVYARDASLDNYFVDDSDIKFAGLDLAIKLLNLIEAIKVTFKKVSTFAGVAGDTETLYYLDTAYDTYEKGFYVFTGSAFVNVDQKCVKFVSTFTGVEGDTDVLYYLDTAYDDYKVGFYRFFKAAGSDPDRFVAISKALVQYVSTFTGVTGDAEVLYYLDTAYDSYKVGFYRFVPAAGTEPAKFIPLGSEAEVFTDVAELPDTNISKNTIYRIPYSYYEYQGMKVEKEDAVWYGPGALCLNMACDNTNGLSLETASQSYQYPLADITDVLVQQLITDQLIQAKSTGTDAPMFKVAANSYCPSEDVTEVDGGYKLYHNPTETDGQYIEIGGGDTEIDGVTIETVASKLQANAIIDVAELPATGIKSKSIYRMLVDKYYEDGNELASVPTGYVSIRPAIVIIDENGITDNGTLYAWADITDDQMDFWVIRRQISQVYAADLMTMSTCFKTADNHYVYKDHVTKDQVYELYHNPTATANAFIKIGGEGTSVDVDDVTVEKVSGKLQANAVIDVIDLPSTGIKAKSIYRTRDVSYEYEGVQFPKSELTLYGPGPDCTSMDADDVGLNIRAASGNRSYPWNMVNDTLIQELIGLNLVAVGVDEADAVFFSHFATYGPKSGLTTIYGDYHIYHNPTETADGYIEIGGDPVQYVSTFAGVTGDTSALYYLDTAYGDYKKGFYRFNGTFQFIGTDVILTVETLPTTDISDSVFYRLVEYHKYDNGWEIPVENTFMSNSPRMVVNEYGVEYTDPQSLIHPYFWADVTDSLVEGWMNSGDLVNVPLSDRNFEGRFYKKQDGTYDAFMGATTYVYIRNEYKLYQNPTKTSSGYIEVGGGGDVSGKLDKLTTAGKYAYIHDGDTQGEAEIIETISEDAASHDKLPTEKAVRDADKVIEERIDDFEFVTAKALNDLNDRKTEIVNVMELPDTGILPDVLYRLITTSGGVTTYKLYHNPTKTNTGWIEIGGDSADAIIVVNTLPTTDIKTNSLYRRMQTVYKHDGVEVPNVTMYKVRLNDTIEATPEGMRYKPSGPVVAWNDANIGAVIQQAITDDHVETATWDNAEFFAYGDGSYDYESHFSRILPGSLWQNIDGTSAGWKEVGGEPAIDEVTIVQENGILQAVAVIDVTTLPSAGMKANALYRKVETVMVPGMHIYTTYYHGGADPVPEPVECYKPARAGVEFRTNEIYIDSVEHSYEELRVYKADWVAAGYIVACDFLDIDTTTNDGAVGYPNEGSYQFLNRARYTYNTDPVPVVMNKIFQRTPAGGWESISTVQISQAAYNELDYDQKMDGTTYIVEG